VPQRTLEAPASATKPMWEFQTNSERCLGSCEYWYGEQQSLSEILQCYLYKELLSTANNMMHGFLFIITSKSYLYLLTISSATFNFLHHYLKTPKKIKFDSNVKADSPKQ